MKMEKKKCTKCKHFLLFECFKNNKRTAKLTKYSVKCFDNCKKLRQQTKCEHGRQRSRCKDCGGGEICKHTKRRPECKDCGGSHICEHNKIKSTRKDCGGGQICEHNKQRSDCPAYDPLGHLAKVV